MATQSSDVSVNTDVFAQNSVLKLTSNDFKLDTPERISLRKDECTIVLFYGNNNESNQLAKLWSQVAQETVGPTMAACNLVEEKKVATAMMEIKSMGSHPFHWASMRGYPFILDYRGGWPVAFYNGDRSVQAMLDWVMTLACQANYYERYDLSGGAQTDSKLEMSNSTQYPSADGSNPIRTQSSEYKTNKPVRQFVSAQSTQSPSSSTTPSSPPSSPPSSTAPTGRARVVGPGGV